MNAAVMFMAVIIQILRRHAAGGAPKIAVPMRTIVAPSSNGRLEVRAGAHRQGIEPETVLVHIVEDLACLAEPPPLLSCAVSAGGMHMRPRSASLGSARMARASAAQLGRRDPTLALFTAHVELQADVERRGVIRALRGEPLGDLESLDAVHPGELLRDGACLVSLQSPDEMPGELAPGKLGDLGQAFLQEILAEMLDAGAGGAVNCCGALTL